MARMNVSIAEGLLRELHASVPPRRRSAFVAEAVREKLARLGQELAVRGAAGSWSNEGRPDPETFTRELRERWRGRDYEPAGWTAHDG